MGQVRTHWPKVEPASSLAHRVGHYKKVPGTVKMPIGSLNPLV